MVHAVVMAATIIPPRTATKAQRARRLNGWSQSEVAAAVGITRAHLSQIENSHDTPSPRVKRALAAILKVDETHLLEPAE